MIKLRVGIRGDKEGLKEIFEEFGSNIYEVFSAPPHEVSATGRSATIPITLEDLEYNVKLAHKHGVRYSIVINALCYSGREYTKEFEEKMRKFIQHIQDIGVDSVVIANTHLLEIVSKYKKDGIPEINTSTFMHINSLKQAKKIEEMGADVITPEQHINRNFKLLKEMKENLNCEISLYANTQCLYNCPFRFSHEAFISHPVRVLPPEKLDITKVRDPYLINCNYIRRTKPLEWFMVSFIRPEDLHLYEEEIGINTFKLGTRVCSTDRTIKIVRAYLDRKFEGMVGELSYNPGGPLNKELEGLLEIVAWKTDKYEELCKKFYEEHFKK